MQPVLAHWFLDASFLCYAFDIFCCIAAVLDTGALVYDVSLLSVWWFVGLLVFGCLVVVLLNSSAGMCAGSLAPGCYFSRHF